MTSMLGIPLEFLIGLPLFFSFLFLYKKGKTPVRILILLQILSIFSQLFVGRHSNYESFTTIWNILFINLNIFLIIVPWASFKINRVFLENPKKFIFFKKILYKFLFIHILLNTIILVIILIFIPDISNYKAAGSFVKLYDQIPYFSTIFRYAYTTQQLGYLAIPICFYHLGKFEIKKSRTALIYASSSLIAGFAFYSRAQIFTFTLVFIVYFFLVKKTLPLTIQKRVYSGLKKISIILVSLFILITVVRFSAMDYYGDRIPEDSIIKDPIVYSLFDYASQGYSNGLNQLENYSEKKNLKGEQMFRDVYQILNFFGILDWNSKNSQYKIDQAYNYDGGAFNGYTCHLVFNFGYFLTLLISFIYFLFIRFKLKNKLEIPIETMYVLVLLLMIPVVSIFYSGFAILYFPLLFLIFTNFLYFIKIK
jgi:oligosaccharide repeat unit polymerase